MVLATAWAGADELKDAEDAWAEDRLQEALELIEPLIEAKPDDPDRIGLRGRIFFDLGRYDEALEDLEKATELDKEVWGSLTQSIKCRVAFFFADDAKVKKLLPTFELGPVSKPIPYLLEPPGLERYQLKKGRYVIYADSTLRGQKGDVFAAKMMELIYDAYSSVFPFKADKRLISRVYLFGTTSAYHKFGQAAFDDPHEGAAGYYSPSTRALVVNADPRGVATNKFGYTPDAINTMFHEGFHQFVRFHIPAALPAWFDEGLAEYFGPSTARGKRKLNVGVVEKNDPKFVTRYERITRALKEQPEAVWSVARFMRMTAKEFDNPDRSSLNYAQSWSIVHFLIHGLGKKGRKTIKTYFEVLKDGGTEGDAFRKSFGSLNLERLDKAWRKYVLEQM